MEKKFRRIEGGLPPSFSEIGAYRRQLVRLSPKEADTAKIMQIYNPGKEPGRSIYASFTDAELLEIVLLAIPAGQKAVCWERLNVVYTAYLEVRFGGRQKTAEKALAYQHYRELELLWPPDWPERVSPERLLQWGERRGTAITEEMREALLGICERAKKACEPPTLTKTEREKLRKLAADSNIIFSKMNIPLLSKNELKYLKNYWRQQRAIAKLWGE